MIKIHISRILGEKKMKQIDLVRLTGIRNDTINAWYHEYVKYIKVEHINKLCEVLNCSVSDLIEYIPDKK